MLSTILIALCLATTPTPSDSIIIDSQQSLEQAIEGTTAPDSITRLLTLVDVEYYSFDSQLHRGQIVVHRDIADDIAEVFRELKASRFPVESVIPIRFDKPNNGTSMDTLNNSYGFHYRRISTVKTVKLSTHSSGRAIDINPFQNPAILRSGRVIPAGGSYNIENRGTLTANSSVTKLFLHLGWEWGGTWTSLKDYMHFEAP